jgi:hypothetical protein
LIRFRNFKPGVKGSRPETENTVSVGDTFQIVDNLMGDLVSLSPFTSCNLIRAQELPPVDIPHWLEGDRICLFQLMGCKVERFGGPSSTFDRRPQQDQEEDL